MINLELPKNLADLQMMIHAAADQLLRPISRKYDKNEHEVPVELEVLATQRAPAGDGKKKEREPGNRNGSNMSTVISVTEMCWGDVGLLLSIPASGLGNAAIGAAGTPEQKEEFGQFYASMAITEPGSGSDSGSIQATAVEDGDDYILNGEKIFVTAGGRSNAVVVWANVDKSLGKSGIRSFVVPKGTPGMEVAKLEHKLGIRSSDTATIILTDCRVPKRNMLGKPIEKGQAAKRETFGKVMQTFDNTRPAVASMALGCSRAALDLTYELLGEPLQLDKPIHQLTATQAALAEMEADWDAARLLTLRAAWMADNGQPNSMEASMAKAKAGRIGNYITLKCVELCGSVGYSEEHLLEKFSRDSKILDIFEGTQQIQQLIVARRILNKSSKELK